MNECVTFVLLLTFHLNILPPLCCFLHSLLHPIMVSSTDIYTLVTDNGSAQQSPAFLIKFSYGFKDLNKIQITGIIFKKMYREQASEWHLR